jgi:hypothetical protein
VAAHGSGLAISITRAGVEGGSAASSAGGGSGCTAPVSGGDKSNATSPRRSARERSLRGSLAPSRGAATRNVDEGGGGADGDLHEKWREVRRPATGARGGGREVSTAAKAERKRWRDALTQVEAVKRDQAVMGAWNALTRTVGSGKATTASDWLSGRGHGRPD